jgi:hypothetical protein
MQSILMQLPQLPLLQLLALPAALLCSSCCNEGQGAAAGHAALLQTLETVTGISSSGRLTHPQQQQHDAGSAAAARRSSTVPSLQQLVFVDAQWPEHSSCYAEECWQHQQQHEQAIKQRFEALQERQHSNCSWQQQMGDESSDCCAGDRDQDVQLQLHMGLVYGTGACLTNRSGDGVWGVYGPNEF